MSRVVLGVTTTQIPTASHKEPKPVPWRPATRLWMLSVLFMALAALRWFDPVLPIVAFLISATFAYWAARYEDQETDHG